MLLSDHDLAALIQMAIQDSTIAPTAIACVGPTYIALRRHGLLQHTYWHYGLDMIGVVQDIVNDAIAFTSQAQDTSSIDAIELCFTYDYQFVPAEQFRRQFGNVFRGIRGIEIQHNDTIVRYSPTRMIANNLSFQKIFENFLSERSLSAAQFLREGGTIQSFESRQVLVRLSPAVQVLPLHRGNRIVSMDSLSKDIVTDMINTMGQWMLRQIDDDGRMVYKYFPSQGTESDANNLIRQFMATLCLIRYAQHTQRPEHSVLATHNLSHNLRQFYHDASDNNDVLGVVEYQGKVKLGAVALAALAILEHANGDVSAIQRSPYAGIFNRLCKTIDWLWQPDGSFHTFYRPSDRNDNQNFYPGEALLFWATLYRAQPDTSLLEKCYASIDYYQAWHRQHRNPAFIPWHTQAYRILFEVTGDRQLLEYIFDMNDWLLPMQQWHTARHGDIQGRFYDPSRSEYGPPHASSTGVYLEGLADAYALAQRTGDVEHSLTYQEAIWRGVRSLRQLQFLDEGDMFYISKRSRVHGGVRTTVYDNVIRVDNVQHGLMALLKLSQDKKFMGSRPSDDHSKHSMLQQTLPELSPMEHLQHFRRLSTEIDITPFLDEIRQHQHDWLRDTSRQDKIKVQRETNTIYLRSAVKPFPPGIISSNDVHDSQYTKLSSHFPKIVDWLKTIARSMDATLGRATLVRLAPNGRVYRHIDHGDYYQRRDRYHLVLHSPSGSLLGCDDEWVRMQPGELWWFNNKLPHEAINESDDWRIHLIFDVEPNVPGQLLSQTAVGTHSG
jgi:hypothetical protein